MIVVLSNFTERGVWRGRMPFLLLLILQALAGLETKSIALTLTCLA